MDRGAWRAIIHSVAELGMTEATEHTHIYSTGNTQSNCTWLSNICINFEQLQLMVKLIISY